MITLSHQTGQSQAQRAITLAVRLGADQFTAVRSNLLTRFPALAAMSDARQVQMMNSRGRFRLAPLGKQPLPAEVTEAELRSVIVATVNGETLPPMVNEPNQAEIDRAAADRLNAQTAARKAAQEQAERQGKPSALVEVNQDGYELSLFPWEDPAQVIAEIENIRDEVESKPFLGWEFTDEELNELFFSETKRVASDPMLARWEADGKPGGFMFTRDFAGARGGLADEPGYAESTQPYAW